MASDYGWKPDRSALRPTAVATQEVTGPDQIWVGDITYLRVSNKWRYLAVVMDMYSRRILGWALGKNQKVDLTLRALNYAIRNRQPGPGVYFHSDRGIEYTGLRYHRRLKQLCFIKSMNRPGKMIDNAYMESFVHSFKSYVYHGLEFRTETSIREVLRKYMPFYNQRRLHPSLDYVSPAQ